MLQAGVAWRTHSLPTILGVLAASLAPGAVLAKDFPVNTEQQLQAALNAGGGAQNGDTVTFANSITLTRDLPVILRSVTINGRNFTLSGNNQFRGLFAYGETTSITINDLTIANMLARGGDGGSGRSNSAGGGGGAGLGGALFVAFGAAVSVSNVNIRDSRAVGGNGSPVGNSNSWPSYAGGGGGIGGKGGDGTFRASGGGGGLGNGAAGGEDLGAGAAGMALNTVNAGGGYGVFGGGGAGGGSGGGGGSSGGGGGVNGGTASGSASGNGGFGGGGGGAYGDTARNGGTAGFGGGGGGSGPVFESGPLSAGGNGGFGGGGGGGGAYTVPWPFKGTWGRQSTAGAAGFGGGNGAPGNRTPDASDPCRQCSGASGGGGAGMGGAIFVQQDGRLTLAGPLTIQGNSVQAGAGGPAVTGANKAGDGRAFGPGIFLQGNGTLVFSPAQGGQIVADGIADQTGNDGTGSNAGAGSVVKTGAGTTQLLGANSYSGTTTLNGGNLWLNTSNLKGDIATAAGTVLTLSQPTDAIYAGNISGGGIVTKLGAGSLVLTGTLSYSGDTSVGQGALQGRFSTLTGNILLSDNSQITFYEPGTATYARNVLKGKNDTSNASLTKSGDGELTLAGTNTYGGGTTVTGGVLRFKTEQNLGVGRTINLANGTLGTIQDAPVQTLSRSFVLAGAGGIDIALHPLMLTGVVSGDGLLIKRGIGPLFLKGTNTYSRGTRVEAGALAISADANLGPAGTTLELQNNSALQAEGSLAIKRPIRLTAPGTPPAVGVGGVFVVHTADTLAIAGAVLGNGALRKVGAGALDLTGATLSHSGGVFAEEGRLRGLRLTSGQLRKAGNNKVVLAGANAVAGGTIVEAGTLSIAADGVLASTVTVNPGGTLDGSSRVKGDVINNGGKVIP